MSFMNVPLLPLHLVVHQLTCSGLPSTPISMMYEGQEAVVIWDSVIMVSWKNISFSQKTFKRLVKSLSSETMIIWTEDQLALVLHGFDYLRIRKTGKKSTKYKQNKSHCNSIIWALHVWLVMNEFNFLRDANGKTKTY